MSWRDEKEYWPDHIDLPQNDWLFSGEQLLDSVSVRAGLTRQDEKAKLERMYNFIKHMANSSQVTFLAVIFLHRYYQRVPVTTGNHWHTCVVMVFLASRVLEQHRSANELALKGAQITLKNPGISEHSKEFWIWKDELLKNELVVMDKLCCDFAVYDPFTELRLIMEKNTDNEYEMDRTNEQVVKFWSSVPLDKVSLPRNTLRLMNLVSHTQVYLVYPVQEVMIAMMIATAVDFRMKWPKYFFGSRGLTVDVANVMSIYRYIAQEQNLELRKLPFFGFGNFKPENIKQCCSEDFVGLDEEVFVDFTPTPGKNSGSLTPVAPAIETTSNITDPDTTTQSSKIVETSIRATLEESITVQSRAATSSNPTSSLEVKPNGGSELNGRNIKDQDDDITMKDAHEDVPKTPMNGINSPRSRSPLPHLSHSPKMPSLPPTPLAAMKHTSILPALPRPKKQESFFTPSMAPLPKHSPSMAALPKPSLSLAPLPKRSPPLTASRNVSNAEPLHKATSLQSSTVEPLAKAKDVDELASTPSKDVDDLVPVSRKPESSHVQPLAEKPETPALASLSTPRLSSSSFKKPLSEAESRPSKNPSGETPEVNTTTGKSLTIKKQLGRDLKATQPTKESLKSKFPKTASEASETTPARKGFSSRVTSSKRVSSPRLSAMLRDRDAKLAKILRYMDVNCRDLAPFQYGEKGTR